MLPARAPATIGPAAVGGPAAGVGAAGTATGGGNNATTITIDAYTDYVERIKRVLAGFLDGADVADLPTLDEIEVTLTSVGAVLGGSSERAFVDALAIHVLLGYQLAAICLDDRRPRTSKLVARVQEELERYRPTRALAVLENLADKQERLRAARLDLDARVRESEDAMRLRQTAAGTAGLVGLITGAPVRASQNRGPSFAQLRTAESKLAVAATRGGASGAPAALSTLLDSSLEPTVVSTVVAWFLRERLPSQYQMACALFSPDWGTLQHQSQALHTWRLFLIYQLRSETPATRNALLGYIERRMTRAGITDLGATLRGALQAWLEAVLRDPQPRRARELDGTRRVLLACAGHFAGATNPEQWEAACVSVKLLLQLMIALWQLSMPLPFSGGVLKRARALLDKLGGTAIAIEPAVQNARLLRCARVLEVLDNGYALCELAIVCRARSVLFPPTLCRMITVLARWQQEAAATAAAAPAASPRDDWLLLVGTDHDLYRSPKLTLQLERTAARTAEITSEARTQLVRLGARSGLAPVEYAAVCSKLAKAYKTLKALRVELYAALQSYMPFANAVPFDAYERVYTDAGSAMEKARDFFNRNSGA